MPPTPMFDLVKTLTELPGPIGHEDAVQDWLDGTPALGEGVTVVSFASDGEAFIRRGVETALLVFPTRYTHSPFEMVDEEDLQATVDLVKAFLTTPEPPR